VAELSFPADEQNDDALPHDDVVKRLEEISRSTAVPGSKVADTQEWTDFGESWGL